MTLRRRGTAIVDTPNGILVVSEGGGTYHLPGGVARKGESRRKAAIRELREETDLIATECSYLFEYISHSNQHKVFLMKCTGTAETKNEIKYLAYFDGSNVNVSGTTRKIIERYRGVNEDRYRCKKCGSETSPDVFWGYCDKCNEEFDIAIQNGALLLYKGIFSAVSPPVHYWHISRYLPGVDEPVFARDYLNFNQVKAIVEARRIAKKEGIDRIVFEYSPHYSRWFLDKYLEAHPGIKEDVLRAETGTLRRLKETKKKKILKAGIPVLFGLLLLIIGYVFFPIIDSFPPTILIDNTPPTIGIVSPEEGVVLHEVITVEAYASDPSGIEKVEFEVGAISTVMDFRNDTDHWAGRLDTRKLSDGMNSIKVKAVDKAGNTAEKIVSVTVDNTPPVITIISPRMKTYSTDPINLIYTVNEPASWVGYSLKKVGRVSSSSEEKITLTDNTTLTNLSIGLHDLVIYANDTVGNMGLSRVTFTVTYVFGSLDELISFLREDDLSDVEWTTDYTCHEFANDFIQRAEMKGYYCFTYYALPEDERDMYADALESIRVVKTYAWGTVVWRYDVSETWRDGLRILGHAVVRTTVDGVDVIVDPQTDIILAMKDFTVLYEGEITQD